MANTNIRVAILMGSESDWQHMQSASITLSALGVAHDVSILSAHRTPQSVIEHVKNMEKKGVKVFIAGAGGAAHLAGFLAAFTHRPVVAVPIANTLQGLDALLSMVQMPPGVPVATVAVNGSTNAAILAAEILAVSDDQLAAEVAAHRAARAENVLASNKYLKAQLTGLAVCHQFS